MVGTEYSPGKLDTKVMHLIFWGVGVGGGGWGVGVQGVQSTMS